MNFILGIDEVGRGPWAGPLVVGAAILTKDDAGNYPDWAMALTDSKKLTKKKREALSEIILREAPATGLGWVSSREIDKIGLSEALKLATRRAVSEIKLSKVKFSEVVIDGTANFLAGTPLEKYVSVLKKADFLIKEVSAASIIAKVARDNYMEQLAEIYPNYGFEKHVGYGTAKHRLALESLGPCPEHRLSVRPVAKIAAKVLESESREDAASESHGFFEGSCGADLRGADLREAGLCGADLCGAGLCGVDLRGAEPRESRREDKKNRATTKQLGDRAETTVAEFLKKNGHKILARNHKTPFYEIDIISTKDDKIYFTEVKYRKSFARGTALEMITKEKQEQMAFAAESFLKFSPALKTHFSPLLAAASVSGPDFELNEWFPIV